jgi:hypothetical protein
MEEFEWKKPGASIEDPGGTALHADLSSEDW